MYGRQLVYHHNCYSRLNNAVQVLHSYVADASERDVEECSVVTDDGLCESEGPSSCRDRKDISLSLLSELPNTYKLLSMHVRKALMCMLSHVAAY